MRKVDGFENPADLFTEHLKLERVNTYSVEIRCIYADGRPKATAKLNVFHKKLSCTNAAPGSRGSSGQDLAIIPVKMSGSCGVRGETVDRSHLERYGY